MKTKYFTLAGLVFVLAAFTITQTTGYMVGDKAEDFSLKNVNGKMVALADFKKAKGFIVVFTCNHCPYAQAYEQRIIDLDKKYSKLGYPVIAINPNDPEIEPDDSYENMKKQAKKAKYSFPYLLDEGQKVYPKFGATKTPHVYVLSKKETEYTVEYIGAIDNNSKDATQVTERYVENAVDALLKGEKPVVTSTKAIGCGIKHK